MWRRNSLRPLGAVDSMDADAAVDGVEGVVGLMLAVQPSLTAAQIGGILQRTAQPLPNIDFTWQNDAGFGRIDPSAAIEEASMITVRRDLTDEA